jgi:tetratricopeptide (TPR) repeat protein
MKRSHVLGLALTCFVLGGIVQATFAQNKRPVFSPSIMTGQDPKAAATALLDGALYFAEDGSWERIAVGRAWYLGGDKARGQQLFDAVTKSRGVESSDWFRIGRVYVEAGEWEKAKQAFEAALAENSGDDTGMAEYGAFANVNGDRAKAEELFAKAFAKDREDFWHWVRAGGSYLGVKPQ